jgi:anti-sigma regulatory factor (Ser/Thr protein kinase)
MQRDRVDRPLVQVRARFPARPEGLAQLHAAFDRFFAAAAAARFHPADRVAIVTAAGELAANIVEHACGHLPDAEMSLVLDGHADRIEVAFEDPGAPYEGSDDDRSNARSDGIPQGGMGLSLIRASVDAVEYLRAGDTNRWRIVRRTRPPSARA